MATYSDSNQVHSGPPHVAPCKERRPHGINRFFMTSPKAGRRVEIWGVPQLHHWIELEANPAIKSLCERPLVIQDGARNRPVDFWVSGPDLNKYILLINQPLTSSGRSEPSFPAFRAWAAEHGCEVEEYVTAAVTENRLLWYRNWTSVLQHLSSFRPYLTPQLLTTIHGKVKNPISITALAQSLPNESLDLVRATVFDLVHKGELQFIALSDEVLSDTLQVSPL